MIERIILAHIIADYFLQNNWMAKNKKSQWFPCFVHCGIYTVVMVLIVPELGWYAIPWVFASHAILDGFHTIDWWFRLIRGRSIEAMKHDYLSQRACAYAGDDDMMRHSSIAITWFVQIVADNAAHIVLVWLITLL